MTMQQLHRVLRIALVQSVMCAPAISWAVPTLPSIPGLFVNLNADSASNFTLGGGNEVALWKDLANNGSDGTFQDFGNNTVANQPQFTTMLMPNGQTMNVVDFSRGGTVTGNQSSTANSDFLGSSAGGLRGETFTFGADTAYTLGGTPDPDGLSFFVVWHTDLTSVPEPTSGSGNQARRGRQAVFESLTSDPTVVNHFGIDMGEDTTTTVIGTNTVPNQFHFVRDSPALAPPDTATQRFIPETDVTSNWYISALTANLDGGNVVARNLQSDGTDTTNLTIGTTTFNEPFTAHLGTVMGQNQFVAGTGSRALDGQIAEMLIYNATMTAEEMDSIVNYLKEKYFVAAPTLPGDHNGDGFVDAADYVTWRKNEGTLGQQGYDDWAANFGEVLGSGGSLGVNTSIPEPTALVLLVLGALGAMCCGIRHRTAS